MTAIQVISIGSAPNDGTGDVDGGWHQQVYHDIVTGTPSTDQYNISDFTTNMTNLVNSGIKISKFSDVVYY